MINQKSIDQLKRDLEKKYKDHEDPESMVNAEVAIFRPTFLIDQDMPYCEEEFQ